MFIELLILFGKSFLFVLAALLPILNPAATAPIFLGLTEGASASTRALLARRIARNMFALMTGSMLVGSYVLDVFGISLPIVRVGGGLIVASTAWRLLNASHATDDRRTELAESFTVEHARRQAFYPLTFPMSCGPGSIAAAITVGVSLHLALKYAQRLLKPLGDAGSVIFLRLSAFILLCLGVQIVWDGLEELLRGLIQAPSFT